MAASADYVPNVLYRLTRNTYQRLLNRDHWRERLARRDFFREHIHPGDLVFDVGANRGHYAETFRELGARVVAVEANPTLAREIRRHFPDITVEAVAVGREPGRATFRLGADTGHSTLSPEWAALVPERWVDTITVDVTTLDHLIEKHGAPVFLKLDVEGFEAEALAGLDTPIPTLMFEYLARLPDVTSAVVARLDTLGPYRFRLPPDREWVTGSDVLTRLAGADGSGDVLAQLL